MVTNHRKHIALGPEASYSNEKAAYFIPERDGRGNNHATASHEKGFDVLAAEVLRSKEGPARLDALLAKLGIEKEKYLKWKRGVELQQDGETLLDAKLGDKRAMAKIVAKNIGLVNKVASRRVDAAKTLEMEDLRQEGMLGLLRAAELFDFEKEIRFSTYAILSIERKIDRAIEKSGIIALPSYIQQKIKKASKANFMLRTDTGEPSFEELAKKLGIEQSALESFFLLRRDILSLDYKKQEGKDSVVASIAEEGPGVEQQYIHKESTEKLRKDLEIAMRLLNEREACAIRMRFFMPYPNPKNEFEKGANAVIENAIHRIAPPTSGERLDVDLMPLEKIGAYLHVSRERARQLIARASSKLRAPLREYSG